MSRDKPNLEGWRLQSTGADDILDSIALTVSKVASWNLTQLGNEFGLQFRRTGERRLRGNATLTYLQSRSDRYPELELLVRVRAGTGRTDTPITSIRFRPWNETVKGGFCINAERLAARLAENYKADLDRVSDMLIFKPVVVDGYGVILFMAGSECPNAIAIVLPGAEDFE